MFGLRNPFKQTDDPPDPPAVVGIYPHTQSVGDGGYCTRIYCSQELPHTFNDDIEAAARLAVDVDDAMGGINIMRYLIEMHWQASSNDFIGDTIELCEVMVETLTRLYGMQVHEYPAYWTHLPRSVSDHEFRYLQGSLNVDWSTQLSQR